MTDETLTDGTLEPPSIEEALLKKIEDHPGDSPSALVEQVTRAQGFSRTYVAQTLYRMIADRKVRIEESKCYPVRK
jgi:hypothetical protein